MKKSYIHNGFIDLSNKSKSGRLVKEYRIVYKENNNDKTWDSLNYALCIDSSLLYAKRYATKWKPHSKIKIIEIYCYDFNENEPIATKIDNRNWIRHHFLKDFDFWDFTGNTGY